MSKKLTAVLVLSGLWYVYLGLGVHSTRAEDSKSKSKEINWVSYDQGLAQAKKKSKHILVDFYTTWCGWCKKMDKDTYSNQEIKKLLAENYVAVKLNAESPKSLSINGKNVTERQVAQEFKVTGFPTTCFLKADGEKIACLPGYASPESFVNVLSYIKDRAYEKEMRLDEYIKQKEEKKAKN